MLQTDIKYFYNKNVKLSQWNGKCCHLSGYIRNYDLAVDYEKVAFVWMESLGLCHMIINQVLTNKMDDNKKQQKRAKKLTCSWVRTWYASNSWRKSSPHLTITDSSFQLVRCP